MCASGFYNECTFHRNIKGFMVQTGDPTGREQLKHLAFSKVIVCKKFIGSLSFFQLPSQVLVKVEQVYGVENLKMSSVNT